MAIQSFKLKKQTFVIFNFRVYQNVNQSYD